MAGKTHIPLPDGSADRLDPWGPQPCHRYFQELLLTREEKLQTHVSVPWTTDQQGEPEMVAILPLAGILPGQIACRARLRAYRGRMRIEQSFRADKSGGFDLAQPRLQPADRLDHLWLALASATLGCHALGELVLTPGDEARCQVAPAHQRTLSLFQLALRWLQRALATSLPC